MLGTPIAHSLSPVIHGAGFVAAGLVDWSYTAIECAQDQLADLVAGLEPGWAGLSLTMPLKEVALVVADTVEPMAAALGAANTLVRGPEGWHAVNTDAPGMLDALGAAGVDRAARVAVLGGGGTARAALGAAAGLGAAVTVYARRAGAIDALRPVAAALGVTLTGEPWSAAGGCAAADVVISTVPKGVADHLAGMGWRPETVVFDVVYAPWPTAIAGGAHAAGCRVVSGLDLLLAQAVRQFERFTGTPAPVGAMGQALAEASNADAGAMWIR
ncbi:MAG: shikimate dehydrogenase [Dactylosporangium sp.]|nr:shikimate dehydrogenase [Dactylosporangium sp.]NNJ60005.1 shikimate dehydrogenase [Dactylosporangium sp.]